MRGQRRWGLLTVGGAVTLFGLGCLNYTEATGWEHHTRQAERFGWPPPSRGLQRLGMAATALGAGVAGFASARRPTAKSA